MSRYDFGAVCAGDIATANFRLRNTANGRATITLLSVAGAGLTLSPKPALPLTLTAQGSADFTVAFQGSSTGGYSAALSTDALSVLLTNRRRSARVDVRNSDRVGHTAARCIAG